MIVDRATSLAKAKKVVPLYALKYPGLWKRRKENEKSTSYAPSFSSIFCLDEKINISPVIIFNDVMWENIITLLKNFVKTTRFFSLLL